MNAKPYKVLEARYENVIANLEAARLSFPGQAHETNRRSFGLMSLYDDFECGRSSKEDEGKRVYFEYWIDRAEKWLERLAGAVSVKHLSHWLSLAENRVIKDVEQLPYNDIKCTDCWDTGFCSSCVGEKIISYTQDTQGQWEPVYCTDCNGSGTCQCQGNGRH